MIELVVYHAQVVGVGKLSSQSNHENVPSLIIPIESSQPYGLSSLFFIIPPFGSGVVQEGGGEKNMLWVYNSHQLTELVNLKDPLIQLVTTLDVIR